MTLDELHAGMTPGPWEVHYQSRELLIFSANNWGVAYLPVRMTDYNVQNANAHLIALAPAMLDAVDALRDINRGDMFSDAIILVERAGHPGLAKALAKYRDNARATLAKIDNQTKGQLT